MQSSHSSSLRTGCRLHKQERNAGSWSQGWQPFDIRCSARTVADHRGTRLRELQCCVRAAGEVLKGSRQAEQRHKQQRTPTTPQPASNTQAHAHHAEQGTSRCRADAHKPCHRRSGAVPWQQTGLQAPRHMHIVERRAQGDAETPGAHKPCHRSLALSHSMSSTRTDAASEVLMPSTTSVAQGTRTQMSNQG